MMVMQMMMMMMTITTEFGGDDPDSIAKSARKIESYLTSVSKPTPFCSVTAKESAP